MKKLFSILCVLAAAVLVGCNPNPNEGQTPDETPLPYGDEGGVFVLCEGSYSAGNASLWFYNPASGEVVADVFGTANDALLGDVGQSLYMYNGLLFVVVNNSGVVWVLDRTTGKVKTSFENLTSPRFVTIDNSGTKGYISQLKTNQLITFDPRTLTQTGTVTLEGIVSSEQMALVGDKLFVASWSNDHKITVLDTTTNTQIATFEVGVQPYSMVVDKNDTLWVMCDGGNEWSTLPEGVTQETPSLWKINAETYEATKTHTFEAGGYFRSRLAINGSGDTLYFIYDAVWEIDVTTGTLPSEPLIVLDGETPYGLDVDPTSGDIYIADAKDYASNGEVLRYSADGVLKTSFEVGLLPSKIAFFGE